MNGSFSFHEAPFEVDVRGLDGHALDRAIQSICDEPPGADVILRVGRRQHVPELALRYLADNGRHLGRIYVRAEFVTRRLWVEAAWAARIESDVWAASAARHARGPR